MATVPASISTFLAGSRLAVAGVSRDGAQAANAIYRRLRDTGHDVAPVNPHATEIEGARCFPSVADVPGPLDGVVIATAPEVATEVVRQCAARGVKQVWFHRSIGDGSVSDEAVRVARELGLEPIVGGCPLMFCGQVDPFHACMRWWLQRAGRVPR